MYKKNTCFPIIYYLLHIWFNFKLNFIFIKLKIGKNSDINMGIRLSIAESAKSLCVYPFKLFQLIRETIKFQALIERPAIRKL